VNLEYDRMHRSGQGWRPTLYFMVSLEDRQPRDKATGVYIEVVV